MKHVLSGESKADPYSVSTIYCYLYHKEHEIDRLTTVLECIRYNIPPEDTMRYIRNRKQKNTGGCNYD
ncbi:MAG: V0D/AC39 family V-type ATPase subunit [Ruminococcus sp.]